MEQVEVQEALKCLRFMEKAYENLAENGTGMGRMVGEGVDCPVRIKTYGELYQHHAESVQMAASALEEVQQYRELGTVRELKDMKESSLDGLELAKIAAAVQKLKKYEEIGTAEECREARERQRAKKPTHFYKKYGKHKWKKKENGEIDDFAWGFDYHNGVACEICGETVCVHCNPNYDELDDCEEEYWICPNCGKKIYCKDEYCKCGQHLDWSDSP